MRARLGGDSQKSGSSEHGQHFKGLGSGDGSLDLSAQHATKAQSDQAVASRTARDSVYHTKQVPVFRREGMFETGTQPPQELSCGIRADTITEQAGYGSEAQPARATQWHNCGRIA
eukprot:3585591-Rhodomonas_salina.1